ncbi:acyltransferase family protein [Acinetobacter sp.]|uniref:acyltransferase family protein n=1 Tax=Acinetobacter sp. TaxID=472 RepID=UPI0029154C82|nr:acyltransferase family protein [Acinetobacter sp.]MDU4033817.1 acyltransferase family protein [Acinetobacter sp.]
MDISIYKETTYRNDIQGVRAIGAILIMIYHIWFSKVSGGVDVFFVVSGYFMAGMLARSYLRNGKVKPFEFWGRIIRRIAPLAYTVIAATFVAGFFLMPPSLWRGSINEVLTSALHLENWQLIRVGTNYLASSNPPSPLQQFWALSLQMQFYLFLPLILFLSIALSKLVGSYKVVLFVVALVIVSSFGFSIYYTNINPTAAYFHTGTRAWEFFVGVAIFIASPFISLSPTVSRVLMWVGFLLILAVGVFVPDSATYPGYIAALPVAAAAIMIIAGISDKAGYVYQMLSSKALVYIGGISFSLYLWHWPILIYFQHYSGVMPGEMTLIEGLFVIALAFTLSVISKKLIENPFAKIKNENILAPYFIGLVFFIPVFISSYYARTEVNKEFDAAKVTDYVNGDYYTGDSAYVQEGPTNLELNRLLSVSNDVTRASVDGCSDGIVNDEISFCEFGDKNSENYILLVGGSRLAQWAPLFYYLGEKDNFKVINATMNSCSFGYHPYMENSIDCQNWNNKIVKFISSMEPKPKAVIVNSSRTENARVAKNTGIKGSNEYTPPGYVENIKEVLSLGIPVIGLRINPILNDPNYCLWKNSDDGSKCATNYSSSLKKVNPIIQIKEDEGLNGFYPVDFTEVICSNGVCPAIFDGYPTMRIDDHLTRSYISYLAPALEKSLDNQVGGFSKILNK